MGAVDVNLCVQMMPDDNCSLSLASLLFFMSEQPFLQPREYSSEELDQKLLVL